MEPDYDAMDEANDAENEAEAEQADQVAGTADPDTHGGADDAAPAQKKKGKVAAKATLKTARVQSLRAVLKSGRFSGGTVKLSGRASVTQTVTLTGVRGALGRAKRSTTKAQTALMKGRLTRGGKAALSRRAGKRVHLRLATTIKAPGEPRRVIKRSITLMP